MKLKTKFKVFAVKKNLGKGFTLIELLVVISALAFLASIILISVSRARMQARDSLRIQQITTVRKAIDLYYQDKGYYPGEKDLGIYPFNTYASSSSTWGTLGNILRPYLPVMPPDIANGIYYYEIYTTGTATYGSCPGKGITLTPGGYILLAMLEDPENNPQYKPNGGGLFNPATMPTAKRMYFLYGGKYTFVSC